MIRKKPINELAVRGKIEEVRTSLQSRYSALAEEADLSIQAMNDNLSSIITECAIAVGGIGGKFVRRDTSKLSLEKKVLIKKRQRTKVSNLTNRIGLAELSMLINRRKVTDVRKYNMERTDVALKNGGSLKVVKGNISTDMDKIVKIAEEFYRDL